MQRHVAEHIARTAGLYYTQYTMNNGQECALITDQEKWADACYKLALQASLQNGLSWTDTDGDKWELTLPQFLKELCSQISDTALNHINIQDTVD
jgi:hypothetical protein